MVEVINFDLTTMKTTTNFTIRILLITLGILSNTPSQAQLFDFSFGGYHSTASYFTGRGIAKTPLGNPERYHLTGFYIKAYEGSLIENLFFSKSRFSVGEYFRLGVGAGILYSPEFQYLKDDGSITTGFGGVNGSNELVAYGPVEKSSWGALADLSYGLQFRYKFKPDKEDSPILGYRRFYSLMVNPIINNNRTSLPEGFFLSGANSFYYMQKHFGVTVEWDTNRGSDDQSIDNYYALTLKKINPKNSRYIAVRADYLNNSTKNANYNMNAFSVQLQYGFLIF